MDGYPINTMTFQLHKVHPSTILSSKKLTIGTTPILRLSNTPQECLISTQELLIIKNIDKIDTLENGKLQLKDNDE